MPQAPRPPPQMQIFRPSEFDRELIERAREVVQFAKKFWRSPIRLSCSKGTVRYSLRRPARLPHLQWSSGPQNRERFRHGKTPGLSAARLPPWPRGPTRRYTYRRKSVPTLLWRPQPLAAGGKRRIISSRERRWNVKPPGPLEAGFTFQTEWCSSKAAYFARFTSMRERKCHPLNNAERMPLILKSEKPIRKIQRGALRYF